MKSIKAFCSYYRSYVKWLVIDLLCAAGSSLICIVFPVVVDYIMSDVLPRKRMDLFLLFMGGAFLAYCLNTCFLFVINYIGTYHWCTD